jgi:FO synthase
MTAHSWLKDFAPGRRLRQDEAAALITLKDAGPLLDAAARHRDAGHGRHVTYSRKVFIPLTKLCRDVCHYCTFAQPPRAGAPAYLSIEEAVAIAKAGREAGCKEALFTLGDKPELRYSAARKELDRRGHATTLSYLAEAAATVFRETGLLPHVNPGVMTGADIDALRKVSVSQGIMLESVSPRLNEKGGPHFGSPDKAPAARLETIRLAGERAVPFTSGILIGIGETRQERIDSLFALRELHDRHGHLQEIIIQNFRPKPGTRMADATPPSVEDHLWTIAVARLIFGPEMNIQAPPNLSPGALGRLIAAGINDWGGVSPVTPDHVNPEAPWPHLQRLEAATRAEGKELVERLAIYPAYARSLAEWADESLRRAVLGFTDGDGLARTDSWCPGRITPLPRRELDWLNAAPGSRGKRTDEKNGIGTRRQQQRPLSQRERDRVRGGSAKNIACNPSPGLHPQADAGRPLPLGEARLRRDRDRSAWTLGRTLDRARRGDGLTEAEIAELFRARGDDFAVICRAADELRREVNGGTVSYVVTRNINYTNICSFKCQFCAFSKGKMSENLRGRPYDLDLGEIAIRAKEAAERGATEVCLQGGIHPAYTGQRYLDICRAVKEAVQHIHIHAFSPLEIFQGARTLGLTVSDFLRELKAAGLGTLPGTAAEILDDEVRAVLCKDKINTRQWLEVMQAAHTLGLRSTATIMFGHLDGYRHWARHLLRIRSLQAETGGFTEFVPLPFVHMEAPVYLKGRARPGPTFREAVLMHAVSRLVLHPYIGNIQASWVKLGADGVRYCLAAGVNDLGGTLMDESISRSAGASHGQEMTPQEMAKLIRSCGRTPRQRTTLYGDARATSGFRSKPASLDILSS